MEEEGLNFTVWDLARHFARSYLEGRVNEVYVKVVAYSQELGFEPSSLFKALVEMDEENLKENVVEKEVGK